MGAGEREPGAMAGRAGLVTGAASGIGRASAVALGSAGAAVLVADLAQQREAGEETVRLVEQAGGRAAFLACDVTRRADCERAVAATVSAFGRLDFAHNNAGVFARGAIADVEDDELERALAINVTGLWHGVRAQVRRMVEQGSGGAILNTSSMAGLSAGPGAAPYVMTKHAVIGLTRSVALDYAAQGIRVNAICPGVTRTPMTTGMPEEVLAGVLAKQMLPRVAEPREIADAAVWLLSDRASFVTGAAIAVDGGATACF